MSDTLAERLRSIATWLDGEAAGFERGGPCEYANADEYRAKATEVRTLADYVDGRAVVGVAVHRIGLATKYFASVGDSLPEHLTPSASIEEARTDLQSEIDNIDGRVLP